jgi:hypothetical protein
MRPHLALDMHWYSIMKLTTPILRDIAQQITTGNPLLGLAVANEYLAPSTELHKALATQVRGRITRGIPHSPEVAEHLLQGKRCGELPVPLRAQIGKRSSLPHGRKLPVLTAMRRRALGEARRAPAPRLLRRSPKLSFSQLILSGDSSPGCARSSCSSMRRS